MIKRDGGSVMMGNVWVTGTLAANTISSPGGDFVAIEGITTTNGLVATGNVSGGNLTTTGNVTGSILKSTYSSGSEGGEIQMALPAGGTTLSTNVTIDVYQDKLRFFEAGGSFRGAYIDLSAASATVGSNLLAGGGGGSPGGSDSQIQYNNGGSFGGNAAMTFNDTTGNIGLGNLIVNTQQIQTTANANVGLTTSLTPNPGRIVVGSGYNGNTSPAYDQANQGRAARLLISDSYGITDANSLARGAVVQNYYTLNGNITGGNLRLSGISSSVQVGGGAGANTNGSTSIFSVVPLAGSLNIGGGTSGNLTGLGNTTVQTATAFTAIPSINAGSTGGNIFGSYLQLTCNGTSNTLVGYGLAFNGSGTHGNTYGVYMPNGTNTYGISGANNPRNANFWFLKNDDDHSYSDIGQLSQFQETQYALSSSSGAVAVNKSNGQVQLFTVSEDATVSFSNFVVSSTVSSTTRYMTDTVTVIVKQDATGRTITMPSGSAYKYAGGANTIPSTASSVSMVSITAYYDTTAAATAYLITISPEFS